MPREALSLDGMAEGAVLGRDTGKSYSHCPHEWKMEKALKGLFPGVHVEPMIPAHSTLGLALEVRGKTGPGLGWRRKGPGLCRLSPPCSPTHTSLSSSSFSSASSV